MEQLVAEYGQAVVFLHVISAVVWVGGMIAMRIAVHPVMGHIEDPKQRVARSLEAMHNLFRVVLPFIVILLLTALMLELGLGLRNHLTTAKEALWVLMALNYAYMVMRRNRAQQYFLSGHAEVAGNMLKLIPTTLLPINIGLGMLAIYLGVVLRGF